MRRFVSDRCLTALRIVSLYKEHGYQVINDDRPPVFDYLVAAHLLEIKRDEEKPDIEYWILTSEGKDTLKRLNNRAKRRMINAAISAISISITLCVISEFLASSFGLHTVLNAVKIIAFYCEVAGFASLTRQLELYLDDYSKYHLLHGFKSGLMYTGLLAAYIAFSVLLHVATNTSLF